MEKDNEKQQDSIQEFPEHISSGCMTFTSHELFWKELETIVVDGVESAED
ncbi:hypothetical protein ACFSFW_01985 [Fredinandcohnia salidurans]|uniref:Uncharacterized protein n=1 Tax=Fredinandcohnia salidurans TaxID=2595041 RepID=A0ABW4MHX3_9BACI|nr:hypothetical protein [Fredinandcohnia onubensis]